MMQKQKGFSAPVLALSVWTAALAEEMQTGISPRGMIIHGAVQALLLTCISGVFSACWQQGIDLVHLQQRSALQNGVGREKITIKNACPQLQADVRFLPM